MIAEIQRWAVERKVHEFENANFNAKGMWALLKTVLIPTP